MWSPSILPDMIMESWHYCTPPSLPPSHPAAPSGLWAGPPWVCRGCGPPDGSWAAGWAGAQTPGSAPGLSPALRGSPAAGCPQTGCWTRWTHPPYRTGRHRSACNSEGDGMADRLNEVYPSEQLRRGEMLKSRWENNPELKVFLNSLYHYRWWVWLNDYISHLQFIQLASPIKAKVCSHYSPGVVFH